MGKFDPNIGYDEGNQYEREDCQDLNKAFLSCGDNLSITVIQRPDEDDFPSNVASAERLITQIDSSEEKMWGFKDPRTCLTFPIWQKALEGKALLVIGVFRSPIANWHHYQKNVPKYRLLKRLMKGISSLRAWYIYNDNLMKALSSLESSMYALYSYENFLKNDAGFKDMEAFLSHDLVDKRNHSMHRSNKQATVGYELAKTCCHLFYGINIAKKWDDLRRTSSNAN